MKELKKLQKELFQELEQLHDEEIHDKLMNKEYHQDVDFHYSMGRFTGLLKAYSKITSLIDKNT